MSYKRCPEVSTGVEGESVVQLEDKSLVAVGCKHLRCTISQNPVFEVSARWIDEDGQTRKDAHGHPVETRHRHSASHDEVQRHGLDKMVRACLFLALGEEIETIRSNGESVEIIPFSREVKAAASIRNAVAAASRTFETIQAETLL